MFISKMRKTSNGGDGVDRISKLPDEVVCHILSFLPSNEATATCILSTRWRFLWRMVPCIHFVCTKSETYDHVDDFLSLRATPLITRFHLNCKNPYFCIPYIKKWVSQAIHGKVKQLNIFLCDTYRFGSVLIPKLFTCTTLVTLNLNFSDTASLILPPSVHLPSLKTLHLKAHVSFSDFKKIFYGSPALELAHLKQRLISCSFLPELKIVRSSQGIQLSSTNEVFDIVIESDRDHDFVRDYLEDHLQKLVKVKASIAVQDAELTSFDAYEVVFDTLKGLRNVESLSLSDFSSWQEYYQYFDSFEMKYTFDDVIPIFENLVKLELDIKDDDSIFWRLPAKCPKLKVDDSSDVNKIGEYHASE